MTPTAEKDIRSALRQLRGCIGRLAMLRTVPLGNIGGTILEAARIEANQVERELLALLAITGNAPAGAEGTKR